MKNYLNFLFLFCINNIQSGCKSSKIKTETTNIPINCLTSPTHTNNNTYYRNLPSSDSENDFTIEENIEYNQQKIIDNNLNKRIQTTKHEVTKFNKTVKTINSPRSKSNAKQQMQTIINNNNISKSIPKPKVAKSNKPTNTKQKKSKIPKPYGTLKKALPNKSHINAHISNGKLKNETLDHYNIINEETYENTNIKPENINNVSLNTIIDEIKKIECITKKKCLLGTNYETLLKSFITNNFKNFEDILILINKNQDSRYKFFIYDNSKIPQTVLTKDIELKPLIIFTKQICYKFNIIEQLCNIVKMQHKNVKIMMMREGKFYNITKTANIHTQII